MKADIAWVALVVLAIAGLLVAGWIVLPVFAVLYTGAELATGRLFSDDQGWWSRGASLLGWAALFVVTMLALFVVGWLALPAVAVLVLAAGELQLALRWRAVRTAG